MASSRDRVASTPSARPRESLRVARPDNTTNAGAASRTKRHFISLFGSSTLYHGHFSNPKMFHFWMRVDHMGTESALK